MPERYQGVGFAPAEGGLEAENAISGIGLPGQRGGSSSQHVGQADREVRLSEKRLRIAIDLRRIPLYHGPEIGREHSFAEPAFADVHVGYGNGIPGFDGARHR